MTDPIAKLATFTPPAPNRDELLYAAGRSSGRASARAGRWKVATGLLAVTQAVTLAAWLWPAGEMIPTPVVPIPAPAVTPELPVESEPPTPPDPYSYLALMHRDGLPEPRDGFAPGPIRQPPPLTAGSRRFE